MPRRYTKKDGTVSVYYQPKRVQTTEKQLQKLVPTLTEEQRAQLLEFAARFTPPPPPPPAV